ncbi:MAG: hypothetical protein WD025_03310, partial [Bacteriovoracaceae bacterium]
MKNLLLLKGGGGQEHEVSLLTADYLRSVINADKFKVFEVEVDKRFQWFCQKENVELNFKKQLVW